MAKDENTAERVIIMPERQAARRELARELAEMKEKPLDQSTREGGYFLGTDGKPHDAEGRPIKESGKAKGEAVTDPEEIAEIRKDQPDPVALERSAPQNVGAGSAEAEAAPTGRAAKKAAAKKSARKRG